MKTSSQYKSKVLIIKQILIKKYKSVVNSPIKNVNANIHEDIFIIHKLIFKRQLTEHDFFNDLFISSGRLQHTITDEH